MRVNGQGSLDKRGTSVIASTIPFLMGIAFHDQMNYVCYQIAVVCYTLTPCRQTLNLGYNRKVLFMMTMCRKSLIYQNSLGFCG